MKTSPICLSEANYIGISLRKELVLGIQMGYLDPALQTQLQSVLEARRLYRLNPRSLDMEKAAQQAPILQRILQMEIDNPGRLLEARYRPFQSRGARFAKALARR